MAVADDTTRCGRGQASPMADVFAERFTRTRALQCKADAHLAAGREAIDRWKLAEMTDHSSFGNRSCI